MTALAVVLDDERFTRSAWGRFARGLVASLPSEGISVVPVATSRWWLQAGMGRDGKVTLPAAPVSLGGYDDTSETLLRNTELVEAALLAARRGAHRGPAPQCVLCFSWASGLAASTVSRALHIPLVAYVASGKVSGETSREAAAYWQEMVRWLCAHAARIVVPDRASEGGLGEATGIEAGKVVRVRPGIAGRGSKGPSGCLGDFRALFAPADETLIVVLDHASGGVGQVIVPALATRLRNARVVVLLEGPLRPDVDRAIAQGGCGDRVHCRPALAGKPLDALLSSADVVVVPGEGVESGLLALEAMTCGATVVAADSGLSGEMIQHGVAGTLVTPGDVPGFCAAAAELVAHPQRRQSLAQAALRRATRAFGVPTCARRLARVLRDAGRGRPAPRKRARAQGSAGDAGAPDPSAQGKGP